MSSGTRHSLLPDPAMLVERLAQLGMADDAELSIVTMPKLYTRTLYPKDAGDDELLVSAVVTARAGPDGSGSLALAMTAYDDRAAPQPHAMQAPLAAMLCGLYRQAGLDAPPQVLEVLRTPIPMPIASTPEAQNRLEWRWDLDSIRIDLDFGLEENEPATLTLTLCRPLPDAEWQGRLQAGGALAEHAAQERETQDAVLARAASLLAEHRHQLAAHAADMQVFLRTDNDDGGTRTVVHVAGASLWCDENADGFSIHIVHQDGRLEQLRPGPDDRLA